MKVERSRIIGHWAAVISFLLGTGIFGLYFLTSSFEMLLVGYGFIVLAGLVNVAVLVVLLVHAYRYPQGRMKVLRTCGLMLLNIPVMLFYCWFTVLLLNTMRISFTNTTGTTLTDINVVGCELEHIDHLEPGETKTIWVSIPMDCHIDINYLSDEHRVREEVIGYVTNSGGHMMCHAIGGKARADSR